MCHIDRVKKWANMIKYNDMAIGYVLIILWDEKIKQGGEFMSHSLSEMSMEALWQLFPIVLTKHQEKWGKWYEEEQAMLCKLLGNENVLRISHIGSTAMRGIWAKPIVDILVEVSEGYGMGDAKDILVCNGYICMAEDEKRISFNKGYTEKGFAERVFHLHLRFWGDNDELYFRDFLNGDPALAGQYEKLKLSLWKMYEYNRDGYTQAKGAFVAECTERAKKAYGARYC